ncbi:MAG: 50S ribosomal protein L32 [Phycisphaerae bacterium]|jgi:large subunit ribosomal protein L32|nr:50S ribosomal protein L32 [Phycisphaerae bacterium]MDP7636555.1 50S ribosomal protein L32 [Phycisphaerae bacterium]
MLPKQKLSRSRTRRRRSHHARKAANYVDCPQCNSPKLPHTACENCGYVRPGLSLKTEKGT